METGRKIAHLGLATTDIKRDVLWYEEKMGFERIDSFQTPWGEPVCFLQGSGIVYEIYQPAQQVAKEMEGRINHVAFESEDIEEDFKKYTKAGCRMLTNGIEEISTFWSHGIRFFKIAGSAGEEIEFCEIL